MKKLLTMIVLGLLTACSMEQSTKTITNCADNLYSKNNQNDVPDIINLMILKKVPQNQLEKDIVTLAKAGFKFTEILDWYSNLLKPQNSMNEKDKAYAIKNKENINIAKKIAINSDKKVKKFISTSLNKKLESSEYEKYFEACEYERKNTPKTFDAKWAKPKIVLTNIK